MSSLAILFYCAKQWGKPYRGLLYGGKGLVSCACFNAWTFVLPLSCDHLVTT